MQKESVSNVFAFQLIHSVYYSKQKKKKKEKKKILWL